eukprot:5542265-Alexandrium_andersonii.AAC.1
MVALSGASGVLQSQCAEVLGACAMRCVPSKWREDIAFPTIVVVARRSCSPRGVKGCVGGRHSVTQLLGRHSPVVAVVGPTSS